MIKVCLINIIISTIIMNYVASLEDLAMEQIQTLDYPMVRDYMIYLAFLSK